MDVVTASIRSKKKFANEIRELLKKTGIYASDNEKKRKGSNSHLTFIFYVKAKAFRKIWEKR